MEHYGLVIVATVCGLGIGFLLGVVHGAWLATRPPGEKI